MARRAGACVCTTVSGNAAFSSTVPIIVPIAVAVVIYTDVDTFKYIMALVVMIVIITMVSYMMYCMEYERDTVSAIERDREDYPPESEVHKLNDGISGIFRRDRRQK